MPDYCIQLDNGYSPPKIILEGATLNHDIVLNERRTSALNLDDIGFDANYVYPTQPQGVTLTQDSAIPNRYNFHYSGSSYTVGTCYWRFSFVIPQNINQRGLKIEVGGAQASGTQYQNSYAILIGAWGSNTGSETSYNSARWYNLDGLGNGYSPQIYYGSTNAKTIYYPDYRCKCLLGINAGRSVKDLWVEFTPNQPTPNY